MPASVGILPVGLVALLVGLAVACSLSSCDGARSPRTPAEITITPWPLVGGQTARIKYTGKLPATITLDWHPSGLPSCVTIPEAPGYIDILVPREASTLIASDDSREASTVSSAVK